MLDLEAIELIKQLKARYFRFLDTANFDGLESVFTADAEVDFQSPSYQINFSGWPELLAFYQGSFTENRFGVHTGHHPEITVSGDQAVGLWYLQDIFVSKEDKVQFEGSALYRDEYVKENGVWKIKKSQYQRLFEKVTKLGDNVTITASPIGNRFACKD